jgi:phage gpG-like protein
MSVTIQTKLKISPDLDRLLKDHSNLAPDAIHRGMYYLAVEASKKTKESITQLGLMRTGDFLKSVTGQYDKEKAIIGSNKPIAHILEGGAQPHVIKIERKKGIFWPGADHPVKSVRHPGTRAYKFLEGTIEGMEQSGDIESIFERGVREVFRKVGGMNG